MTAANTALTTTRHLHTVTKMENGAKARSDRGFLAETSRWSVAPLVWILHTTPTMAGEGKGQGYVYHNYVIYEVVIRNTHLIILTCFLPWFWHAHVGPRSMDSFSCRWVPSCWILVIDGPYRPIEQSYRTQFWDPLVCARPIEIEILTSAKLPAGINFGCYLVAWYCVCTISL